MPRCKPSTLRKRRDCRDTQTRQPKAMTFEEQFARLTQVEQVPAAWREYATSTGRGC